MKDGNPVRFLSFYYRMGKIEDLIEKLKQATVQEQENNLLSIIRSHEAQLVDLNTRQLLAGENADGGSIGEYKSDSYATFKKSLNPAGVVDLKLTGAFHDSFFLEADKFPVTVFARDSKTGLLAEKYDKIFGFTPKSKEEIKEDIKAEVQDYYRGLLQV